MNEVESWELLRSRDVESDKILGLWMKFLLKLIYSSMWNLIGMCVDLDCFPLIFGVTPKTDIQPLD